MTADELDYVGFYDKPFLKFERLLETYLAYAPAGFRSFLRVLPGWLQHRLRVPREVRRGLGNGFHHRILFSEHHQSHAASAFFPSPFENAAILTFDGVGEWATASMGIGRGNQISLTHELRFPHSLGMLYSAFTAFCGFEVNSGEYKLMGLAAYGSPCYADLIQEKLLDLKRDGSFRLGMRYFRYCQGLTMTSPAFDRLFGGPPRHPNSPITHREMDLAASIQMVTEEIVLRAAQHVQQQTGADKLCLAGGVALNSVANGRLLREGPFNDVWIQPAAGDSGGALGVALLIWHQLLDKPRVAKPHDGQRGSLLGPEFDDHQCRDFLEGVGAPYTFFEREDDLCDKVAQRIADGQVVAWFQGRMEFGPRALGSRSILADARNPQMQSILNQKVKHRETFRPFAPAVLEELAAEYFELPPGRTSPYMQLVARVRNTMESTASDPVESCRTFKTTMASSSQIPAVTHVDGTARVQTVDRLRHGRFRLLVERFHALTGIPVLLNTSFNVRDEPIVCTPADAYRCFQATAIDTLVLGRCIVDKPSEGPAHEIHVTG